MGKYTNIFELYICIIKFIERDYTKKKKKLNIFWDGKTNSKQQTAAQ